MTNTKQLGWLWTALITPFKEWNWIDNEVDYIALEKVLNMQIDWKVDWVLLLWTTAENPTLTKEEQLKITKFTINILKWKTKIMVNIGTYSTKKTLDNIKEFDHIEWIDAYLVVNPYYNKPTQTGLFQHFTTVAKSTSKSIILYNIAWRTGVNLETNTLLDIIWECKNIIWVKEASWKMLQMKEVIEKTWDDFLVLSWDDALTYELIWHWWDWVVSVAANCKPEMMKNFVSNCLNNYSIAKDENEKLQLFFAKLFIQTNPLPAKTFLASKWIIKESFRLPICKMDEKEKEEFLKVVEEYWF